MLPQNNPYRMMSTEALEHEQAKREAELASIQQQKKVHLDEIRQLQDQAQQQLTPERLSPGWFLETLEEVPSTGLTTAKALVAGAVASAIGSPAVGSAVALSVVGTDAFANAYSQGALNGLSEKDAIEYATLNALAEMGSEYIPIKTFNQLTPLARNKLLKQAVKATQFAAQEGGSEVVSNIANNIIDSQYGFNPELKKAFDEWEVRNIIQGSVDGSAKAFTLGTLTGGVLAGAKVTTTVLGNKAVAIYRQKKAQQAEATLNKNEPKPEQQDTETLPKAPVTEPQNSDNPQSSEVLQSSESPQTPSLEEFPPFKAETQTQAQTKDTFQPDLSAFPISQAGAEQVNQWQAGHPTEVSSELAESSESSKPSESSEHSTPHPDLLTQADPLPTEEVDIDTLSLSQDVPQFKEGANEQGVVQPLEGTFDRTGTAPIQVWIRNDGTREVISGRHRLDLAKRSGETTIPAQLHYESQGFNQEQAQILDALLNIREEQGSVKDYVRFFEYAHPTRQQAQEQGLLARNKGRQAFNLYESAGETVLSAFHHHQLSDQGAERIALSAPNNDAAQAVGVRAILQGQSIEVAENWVKAVSRFQPSTQESPQQDMFGFDESYLKRAEQMAKVAVAKQRSIQQSIYAVNGASKNPQKAKALGVNVKKPQALQAKVKALQQEKAQWEHWHTHPELVAEIERTLDETNPTNQEGQPLSFDNRFLLNEDGHSPFAKAIEHTVNGRTPKRYIPLGTTPEAFQLVGMPDTTIYIHGHTIEKVLGEYLGISANKHSHLHNLTPDTLTKLPKSFNDPIAIFSSSTRENSYLVLTDLVEAKTTGKRNHDPVIGVLHVKKSKKGLELIDVASVYGRSVSQLNKSIKSHLLYWNTTKGQQLVRKTDGLQLPQGLQSNNNIDLSGLKYKTEFNLNQAHSKSNVAFSSDSLPHSLQERKIDTKENIENTTEQPTQENKSEERTPYQTQQETQARRYLAKRLGDKLAQRIQFKFDSDYTDSNAKETKAQGYFISSQNKVVLNLDVLKRAPKGLLSREEFVAWTAWHELFHQGLASQDALTYRQALESAYHNPFVKELADTLAKTYHGVYPPQQLHYLSIEEALAELSGALETQQLKALQARYQLTHTFNAKETRSLFARLAEMINQILAYLTQRPMKMTNQQVAHFLREVHQANREAYAHPSVQPTKENTKAPHPNAPHSTEPQEPTKESTATPRKPAQPKQKEPPVQATPPTAQDILYSLDDTASSDFVKAVDDVASGKKAEKHLMVLGTTPTVLTMLGFPKTDVSITAKTIRKVMQDKHEVTPDVLKQIPKELNNPVAVIGAKANSTNPNGFIVLTEQVEVESKTGKEKPLIVALAMKPTGENQIEVIHIASVYGRTRSQIENGLKERTLYWNTTKGSQLANAFGLPLPTQLRSLENLSAENIKTERDLRQALVEENLQQEFSETEQQAGGRAQYRLDKEQGKTELNYPQWVQVRTPSFKRWFGDWQAHPQQASQVVNPTTGEPLVVYHGTPTPDFNVFEKGENSFYFTDDLPTAKTYSPQAQDSNLVYDNETPASRQGIYPVFLNIRHPQRNDFKSNLWTNYPNEKYQIVDSQGNPYLNEHHRPVFFKDPQEAKAFVHSLYQQTGKKYQGLVITTYSNTDSLAKLAKKNAHVDGAFFENVIDEEIYGKPTHRVMRAYIAFESNQVKSAIANDGSFSPYHQDIRYSLAFEPGMMGQEEHTLNQEMKALMTGRTDRFLRRFQDRFIAIKRTQEALVKYGGKLTDQNDTYLALESIYGKVANDRNEINKQFVQPLIQKMKHYHISMQELNDFVYVMHAEERNRNIAKKNPAMPDGGSGITTQSARNALARLKQQGRFDALKETAEIIYRLNRLALEVRREHGLITEQAFNELVHQYRYYVPLKVIFSQPNF